MKRVCKLTIGTLGLLFLGVVLSAGEVCAQTTLGGNKGTYTFTNNSKVAINDLHIDWNRAVDVEKADPFTFTKGSGTGKTDLWGATLNPGNTATVTVTWPGGKPPTVQKWWFTIDAKPVKR